MTELHIDPAIRFWVFLPIVLITFLIGILRHYFFILFSQNSTQKAAELNQIEDSQAILRARLLRENGKYLPEKSFVVRKAFFNDNEKGFFKCHQRPPMQQNLTTMLQDMLKGNFLNVLPMLLIGGWINIMFSGFVTTKVPFPLTLRFKPMLQAGIELDGLDASWVSSASWYVINIFGLRPIYSLMLGDDNEADLHQDHSDASANLVNAMPTDPQTLFKAEWEALELTEYCNFLKEAEDDILNIAMGEEIKLEDEKISNTD